STCAITARVCRRRSCGFDRLRPKRVSSRAMFAVSPMARPLPSLRFLFAFVVVLPAGGCRLPDVNLATREPIKVDINVDLNIYQHGTPESAAAAQAETEALEEVKRRKYNRQEEIQNLKN